jgi:hypothetical protein
MNHPWCLCDDAHTDPGFCVPRPQRLAPTLPEAARRSGDRRRFLRSAAGYTLVEILVATAVFVIFMVGILNLLDTTTRLSEVEKALADTQENVRFAAYHILRTARMIGGGDMPFAVSNAGGDNWVAGVLSSDQSGAHAVLGYGNVDVAPGTDVLTLRGFFEVSPFFVLPQNFNKHGSGTCEISEQNAAGQVVNGFDNFTSSGLNGRGVVFMGEGLYCVGKIGTANPVTGSAPDRMMVLSHEAGDTLWPTLNSDAAAYPPTFRVHRVGIMDSYTFYVAPDGRLMRLRISGGTVNPEPVAVNIGALQIALGVDTNNDGQIDVWNNNPAGPEAVSTARVVGIRITVLGKTPGLVRDWIEPEATFQVEDGDPADYDRTAKWRRIEVSATLRNFLI